MQKGCIQLYYGDGKGKTTAAVGQIVRSVGHGFKVLVYQFLKEPNSGEVSVLKSLPGVEYIENEGEIPFMFNLTPEQQEFYKEKFQKTFNIVREKFFSGEYDLVVLDEVIDAYNLDTVPKYRACYYRTPVRNGYQRAYQTRRLCNKLCKRKTPLRFGNALPQGNRGVIRQKSLLCFNMLKKRGDCKDEHSDKCRCRHIGIQRCLCKGRAVR